MREYEKVSRGEEKWLSGGFRQAEGESSEDSFGGMMVINGKVHLRNNTFRFFTHYSTIPTFQIFHRFRISTVNGYQILLYDYREKLQTRLSQQVGR